SALAAIEAKTPYRFTYEEKDLVRRKGITVRPGKQTVEQILLSISESARVHFKQVNHNIHVKPLKEAKAQEAVTFSEAIPISGRVVSATDGLGIPGVNVLIKGTLTGTVTDMDGNFALDVPNEDDILVFSSIGYLTQEVAVSGNGVIE